MARPLRIEYDGALYHVTTRGNDKKAIFKDENDRRIFLDILKKVTDRHHWFCHAYCLMNNHYHLVIETPDANLSKGMRHLNGVYTQIYNQKRHRVGHLFQGRYKAILIQKESYLLEVCRYVVLNPVRAKATKSPDEWEWSSYCATAGIERPHPCLTRDWILDQMGSRRSEAEKRYRAFVKEGIGGGSIWDSMKGQSLLGEDAFVEELSPYVKKHKEVKEIPRRQRLIGRPSLDRLLEGKRVGRDQRERRIVEAVQTHGYSQREVADYLGMHYSTISKLISKKNQKISRIKT